jgi:RNase P subunit RPR2
MEQASVCVCLSRSPCNIRFDFSLTFIYSTWTSNGIIIVPRALSTLYIILTHTCSTSSSLSLSHEYNARVCIKSCITVLLPSQRRPKRMNFLSWMVISSSCGRAAPCGSNPDGWGHEHVPTRNRCLSAPIFNSENQFFSLDVILSDICAIH